MKIHRLHGWDFDPAGAVALQKSLASRVSLENRIINARYIAGVDISVRRWDKTATGSVVVMSYPEMKVVEVSTVRTGLTFPYVPGLLSFRELPIALEAFEKLKLTPDLVIVDGQGIAHPRRFGLASHLGLFLEIPTIGCAKSRLCGAGEEPGPKPGDFTVLTDKDDTIGIVLRTKTKVKPLFVSPGHLTDTDNAMAWVLNCCRGYRLPEPTRFAHLAAGGNLPDGR